MCRGDFDDRSPPRRSDGLFRNAIAEPFRLQISGADGPDIVFGLTCSYMGLLLGAKEVFNKR